MSEKNADFIFGETWKFIECQNEMNNGIDMSARVNKTISILNSTQYLRIDQSATIYWYLQSWMNESKGFVLDPHEPFATVVA